MTQRCRAVVFLFVFMLAGCAASPPLWRDDTKQLLEAAREAGGEILLPAEIKSIEDTIASAESLGLSGRRKEAESYFYLAWMKATLLEDDLEAERDRLDEEAEKRLELQRREAEARQAREEEERRRREDAVRKQEEILRAKRKQEKARPSREAPVAPVAYHTVRRGETLPQIAAQANVYNDITLWPLIYRANRDQISNPRHIWPGQVLKIPRNMSREDTFEARRYAQERRLY